MQFNMDDNYDHTYRMIEQDIESLLDESQEELTTKPMEITPSMTRPGNFLSYKSQEMAAKEGPILGQYEKWSTVESDELHVSHQFIEQRNAHAQMLPISMQNIVQNIINVLSFQLRQHNMTMSKRMCCSFCKKNGMSL